jgi:hypothetical protein
MDNSLSLGFVAQVVSISAQISISALPKKKSLNRLVGIKNSWKYEKDFYYIIIKRNNRVSYN